MPTMITGSAGGGSAAWAELTADTYAATISKIEDAGPSKFDPDKEQYAFTYALEDKDEAGDAITLRQWVNKVLTPRSKLAEVVAATGLAWEPNKPFDLDDLIGRPVRLMVNVKDGENGPRPYIASVVAPKAAAAKASNLCCVPGCGKPYEVSDDEGNFFCAKHGK